VRWGGVVLIIIGAALISYSEHNKPKTGTEQAAAEAGVTP